MLDAPFLLKTLLSDYWNPYCTDPEVDDIKWSYNGTGFDENACYPQIVIEEIQELPCEVVNIANDFVRVTHPVLITVYIRPMKYSAEEIAKTQTTFRNMKKAIVEVLRRIMTHAELPNQCIIPDVNNVKVGAWKNEIGNTTATPEPIVFRASMVVKLIYYRSGLEWTYGS